MKRNMIVATGRCCTYGPKENFDCPVDQSLLDVPCSRECDLEIRCGPKKCAEFGCEDYY